MQRLLASFAFASALLVSTSAFADEPAAAAPMERTWYGWQTLAADGVSAVTFAVGGAMASSGTDAGGGVIAAGYGTYALAAPVIHLAHRQPLQAAASFGLRLGLPTLGFLVGTFVFSASDIGPAVEHGVIGATIGMVGASSIDAALLSYKIEPTRASSARIGLAPQIDLRHGTYSLAFTGVGW